VALAGTEAAALGLGVALGPGGALRLGEAADSGPPPPANSRHAAATATAPRWAQRGAALPGL